MADQTCQMLFSKHFSISMSIDWAVNITNWSDYFIISLFDTSSPLSNRKLLIDICFSFSFFFHLVYLLF